MAEQTAALKSQPESVLYLAVSLALLVAVFFPMAAYRLIDGDEGFYLLAAKQSLAGKVVYRDFFYPQMPLLPYVYALWMKVFGVGWYSGRMFSALLATLLGLLLFRQAALLCGGRRFGLLAVMIFCASDLAFGWFTVVKTYAFSTLVCFAAYCLMEPRPGARPGRSYFLSGLLLGLAIDSRLLFVAALPALAAGVWVNEAERGRARSAAFFGSGLVAALIPCLYFLAALPGRFMFNNLGYHAMEEAPTVAGLAVGKLFLLLSLLGAYGSKGTASFQFAVLSMLALFGLIAGVLMKRGLSLSLWLTALLLLVSFSPALNLDQYFCIAVPFMIVLALQGISLMGGAGGGGGREPRLRAVKWSMGAALALYVLMAPLDASRYVYTGVGISYINSPDAVNEWRIDTVNQVAREIDKYAVAGEPVITWWPGYLVESRAAAYPGMENHFGLGVAESMGDEKAADYGIISYHESEKLIPGHAARLVVTGNWIGGSFAGRLRQELGAAGYKMVGKVGACEIYFYPEQSAGEGSRGP